MLARRALVALSARLARSGLPRAAGRLNHGIPGRAARLLVACLASRLAYAGLARARHGALVGRGAGGRFALPSSGLASILHRALALGCAGLLYGARGARVWFVLPTLGPALVLHRSQNVLPGVPSVPTSPVENAGQYLSSQPLNIFSGGISRRVIPDLTWWNFWPR